MNASSIMVFESNLRDRIKATNAYSIQIQDDLRRKLEGEHDG